MVNRRRQQWSIGRSFYTELQIPYEASDTVCLRVDRHNYRYNSDMAEVNRTTTIRVYPMPSCVMESDDLSRRFFNFFVFRMGVTGDDRMYHDALSLSRAFHHHRSDIPDNATPVVIIKILIHTSSDEEDPMVVEGEGESDFDEIDHNDDWPLVRILQASMTSTRGLNGSMARAIQESMDEYVALKLEACTCKSIIHRRLGEDDILSLLHHLSREIL